MKTSQKIMMLGWIMLLIVCVGFAYQFGPFQGLQPEDSLPNRPVSDVATITGTSQSIENFREFSYSQLHMAMEVRITVWFDNQDVVETACKKAFKRITELEKIFSDYDRRSEISRLTHTAFEKPVPISPELLEVMVFSESLFEKSGGAFDPTAAPLIKLWRKARKTGKLPTAQEIKTAKKRSGFDNVVINRANQTVHFLAPQMGLDFGGIAKGYIGDQVLAVLRESGLEIVCYESGGDFVLGDPPPDTIGWKINLETGEEIELSHCGVAVSGDSVQFVEIGGQRYSHVIDPRTGIGITTRRTATVIAPRGMMSDSLATTGCVLEENDFQKLLAKFPGVEGNSQINLEDLGFPKSQDFRPLPKEFRTHVRLSTPSP